MMHLFTNKILHVLEGSRRIQCGAIDTDYNSYYISAEDEL